jgi:hypothetical protein
VNRSNLQREQKNHIKSFANKYQIIYERTDTWSMVI